MSMVVPMDFSVIDVKMELESLNCPHLSLIDDYFQHLDIASASGRIVSFMNDLVPFPFLELKANMEAQQDLHGYDHPWPEGGGRNQLAFTVDSVKALNTEGTWSGNAYTHLGVTFTIQTDSDGNVTGINVNGTSSSQSDFILMSSVTLTSVCILNSGANNVRLRLWASGNIHVSTGQDVEVPAGTYSCEYAILSGDGAISNKVSKPMVRLATDSDPSYAPPSNICPISGWTGANVSVNGANLFDKSNPNVKNAYIDSEKVIANSSQRIVYIPCFPNTKYTISKVAVNSGSADRLYGAWTEVAPTANVPIYDRAGWSSGFVSGERRYVTITTGATAKYIVVWISRATEYEDSLETLQIEVGDKLTDYSQYTKTSYSVSWQTEAGTVYGGTLDVTSGVLTITHGFKIFNGTETWGAELTTNFYSPSGRGVSSGAISGDKVWCSHAPSLVPSASVSYLNCFISVSGNFNIQIPSSIVPHTATDMKSWVTAQYNNGTPLTIRYELATPQTVQLTAQQVKMLAGDNNIWTDVDEVEVKYYVKA